MVLFILVASVTDMHVLEIINLVLFMTWMNLVLICRVLMIIVTLIILLGNLLGFMIWMVIIIWWRINTLEILFLNWIPIRFRNLFTWLNWLLMLILMIDITIELLILWFLNVFQEYLMNGLYFRKFPFLMIKDLNLSNRWSA